MKVAEGARGETVWLWSIHKWLAAKEHLNGVAMRREKVCGYVIRLLTQVGQTVSSARTSRIAATKQEGSPSTPWRLLLQYTLLIHSEQ